MTDAVDTSAGERRRPPVRVVRVVGTGLVGASVALALRRLDDDALLPDPSPTALALSRDLGAGRVVDGGTEPDLEVVAAKPDVVADVVLAELAARPREVVTDVASVKAAPLRRLSDAGADLRRYVGGHPLAGRERSGAVAARADLFEGRPSDVVPTAARMRAAVELGRAVATALGARVSTMTAAEHDDAVAVVSHVPQVAASLVASRLREVPDRAVELAGQGVRDVTRIAASDPALWTQILSGNAAAVARVLHAVRADLDAVVTAVDALAAEAPGAPADGARAAVAGLVAAGNEGRARIPGKHGAAPTRYVPVPVLVPDRPGELARLLHDVGAAGVNLEDLHLEHSQGRPHAVAEIAVLPAAAAGLVRALVARGWTVHA
ncbi:prephenate dehydrogenase [Angustibacter aerolatus]